MPAKFKIALNDEQKQAKELILQNTITVLHGKAGSGKTLLACQIALDGLLKKDYKKIVITRPTVSKEDIGFLPGDLREKMQPWISPIVTNFYLLYEKYKIDQWLADGTIEIAPVSFMRGLTFLDACIIVDEAQNITDEQMEMIVTRIGLNSKMIICGDISQIDLKHKGDSGFRFICDCVDRVPNMTSIELKTNHRNEIVDYLVTEYAKKYKKENEKHKTKRKTNTEEETESAVV
jgi:phosphate starvation-inducible PhoH-like protein